MITKLGMIILLEHDVEAAVEFYKTLGFKLIFHIKQSWAEFAIGSVKLGLCPTSSPVQDHITGVVLEVTDIKKFYQEFKDKIPFKSEPVEKVHGIMVSIQDPGGNILDLYQPTPQKVEKLVKEVVARDEGQEGCKTCKDTHSCRCKSAKANA